MNPSTPVLVSAGLGELIKFRQEFKGEYWLEIMLVGGYTALPAEVRLLSECVQRIQPDRVQLNTVTRPPSEEFATPVSRERLQEFAGLFHPRAQVIAEFRSKPAALSMPQDQPDVLGLLRRRPSTLEDVAAAFGRKPREADRMLAELEDAGLVTQTVSDGVFFYEAVRTRSKFRRRQGADKRA